MLANPDVTTQFRIGSWIGVPRRPPIETISTARSRAKNIKPAIKKAAAVIKKIDGVIKNISDP